jgi:hypothetical protein
MTITTHDEAIAAAVQRILMRRTASVTAVANQPTAVWQAAGSPGAGTLAIGNTANGVVPTDAVAGYPIINAFGGGAGGKLARLEFRNSVASLVELYDRVFAAGAYAFNANVTLASQPSYAGRVPGGTDFTGLGIFVEAVTAFTGTPTITVTYTNQAGTTGRTTGAVSAGAALIVGRGFWLPLQAGDSGVQKIESVVATVATVGTFNVSVLRHLGGGVVGGAAASLQPPPQLFLDAGLLDMFADMALYPIVTPDSTATGLPTIILDIRNG